MFYFLCGLFAIMSVPFADADMRRVVHIPPAVNNALQDAIQACQMETEAAGDVVKRFHGLQIEPDDMSKNFLYCVTRTIRFSDEDGHLTKELLIMFEGSEYKDEVETVFDECNRTRNKRRRIDTLYDVFQCFVKNSPVLPTA